MKRLSTAALFLVLALVAPFAGAACVIQSIALGATVNGTLAADDCVDHNANTHDYYYDYYEFTVAAGQQVSITTTSSAIDADLLFIYPDGTYLYDDDSAGGTNPRIPAAGGFLTLAAAGTYHIVASSAVPLQTGAYTMTLATPAPPPAAATTIEFYNTTLKHYFITASTAEANGIDNGAAGPGWIRTGFSYNVYLTPTISEIQKSVLATASPVCRFYGTPGIGPNSHFYTVDPAECDAVKKDPGWLFETGAAYYIQAPQAGACPAGTQPIYRVYNNRAQYNDSNHRFITNKSTFQQMGERGWTLEGIVMCTTGSQAPTPVTGGVFKDPSGTAAVTVAPGQIPPYVNATQPGTSQSPRLPPGLDMNPAQGDTNVTSGAQGYDFNLTGDSGFMTTAAGAVTITLPFDASRVPPADLASGVRVFARVFNPFDGSLVDLTGDIAVNGSAGSLTVETRGLPQQFTAAVIHNPYMESVSSDEAPAVASDFGFGDKQAQAAWPAQSWCVIYQRNNPNLVTAVKSVLGIAANPTDAQIRNVLITKVAANAKKAQSVYEKDGNGAPNLYIGRTCGGTVPRYNLHMTDDGSAFQPDDPDEVVRSGTNHYGRIYTDNSRVDDAVATDLGSVLASVAHEMYHAVQNGYEILGSSPKGYKEGSSTTYGKTIDNGEVITVRSDTKLLGQSLASEADSYDNEDFFAYVGKQYNGGKLNYLAGLFAQLHASIGSGVYNPGAAVMYGAMDTAFKAAFGQSLQAVYLDFVKQRALTHNAASQLRAGDPAAAGFSPGVMGASSVYTRAVALATCSTQKFTVNLNGLPPFATFAFVVNPSGAPRTAGSYPTLAVKLTPATSSVGALWNGFTYRSTVTANLAATNKFADFGKAAGDQVIVLVSNLDPANAASTAVEFGCTGPQIDSISPVKGPVDTLVTINGSGFGAATDTRAVYFNGLKATTATFISDTQATAKVPQNASTGDVVVEVNTEKSNGVNFEVIAACNAQQVAGADTPDTRTIELGKTSGTFDFRYETYFQEDQIIVRYQGATLFDTGCVGANGTVPLHYSGTSTQISVQVIPNCKGGSGTAWNYSVSCP